MEANQNHFNDSNNSLCESCKVFYANPNFNQMCSKCYNDIIAQTPVPTASIIDSLPKTVELIDQKLELLYPIQVI